MSDLLNSASLVMIPSGYKEDVVYSQIPTDGSGDLSFTRASNGTRVNSAGLVEVTPWNLVENSETFNLSPWYTISNTVTANTATAPNGTTTADTFTLTPSGDSSIYQPVSGVSNNYTTSVYAKYVSGDKYLYFYSQLNSQGAKVWFDIQNGTVSNQVSGFVGTIENVGNGWYKCSMYNTTPSVSDYIQFGISTTNSSRTLSNNSVSYFWGAQVNIGSTAKPYFPTTDRLNVPRLTYQNGGGGCPSLLLEKQSTNLVTYSEQFDNAAWSQLQSTVTANNTISPDGTQNADKIIPSTVNTYHYLEGSAVTVSNNAMVSIYAKKGEYQRFALRSYITGNNAIFDVNSGTVVGTTNTTASIESVGNGWYRCSLNDTNSTAWGMQIFVMQNTSTSPTDSYSGNGTDGMYFWGAQIEVSSYPTSYIPTTSSSATRVADACYKTGISSLIGQTQGTLFVDFNYIATTNTNDTTPIRLLGSGSAQIYLEINANNTFEVVVVNSAGSLVFNSTSTAQTAGRHKFAIAYKADDYAYYLNGTQIAVDTNGAFASASLDSLNLGMYQSGSQLLDGSINQAILFPTRLTNAELASLTII